MEFQVNGLAGDLFSFATALRAAGNGGLSRELDRGLRDAAVIVAREVQADDRTGRFPDAYARVFDADLDVKPQIRAVSGHRISVVGVGESGPKGRDVVALNRGTLRHPVFGRSGRRKSGSSYRRPWVAQRVGAGWFSDPFERARPAALGKIQDAWDRVATKVNER